MKSTHTWMKSLSRIAFGAWAGLALATTAEGQDGSATESAATGEAAAEEAGAPEAAAPAATEVSADGPPALLEAPTSSGSLLPDIADVALEDLLAQIVVGTAGKRAQEQYRSVSAVSVITREQLDELPYTELGDFLNTLPGVDARWDKMQRYFVGFRGLSGTGLNSRTLVLVDGQPMNDPLTGEATAGHWLPISDVERIEVIRGPGSSLYGANAFSGVVNVITRHGAGQSLAPRVDALAGSNETLWLAASGGKDLGPIEVIGSIDALDTAGRWPQQQIAFDDGVLTFDNDDVSRVSGALTLRHENVRLTGRYMYGDRGRPGQFPTGADGELLACTTCHSSASSGYGSGNPTSECGNCHLQVHDRETTQRAQAMLSYGGKIGEKVDLAASAFHSEWFTTYDVDAEVAFLQDAASEYLHTRQRMSGAETHMSHTLDGKKNVVLAGAEVRRSEVASDLLTTPDGGNYANETQLAGFLEDELRPVDWLSLVAGARADHNSNFGVAVSPRGGVVVAPDETRSVRLSAARAFRNPNLAELYVDSDPSRIHKHGNPDLQPEWINSFEIGGTRAWALPAVLRVTGTGFYSHASSLVGLSNEAWPSIDTSFSNNLDHATVWGAELEFSADHDWGDRRMGAAVNYSYQDARDQDGEWLPYAPYHKANLTLNHHQDAFETTTRVRYSGERLDNSDVPLPAFTLVDFSIGPKLHDDLYLMVWVRNLGNLTYQEALGIPGMSRSFFVELRFRGDAE